jgi:hypothetical protein
VASLRHEEEELRRQLARTMMSLQREAAQDSPAEETGPAYARAGSRNGPRVSGRARDGRLVAVDYPEPEPAYEQEPFAYEAPADTDAAYADPYSGGADSDGAYSDDAYADEAGGYGDGPFEEEPFGDQDYGDGDPYDNGGAYDGEAFDEATEVDATDVPAQEPEAESESASGAEQARPRRTQGLVSQGRRSASSPWLSRKRLIAMGAAAGVLLILILVLALSGNGASWPASVATVQSEITKACQNGDVASEPGQVNFACAKSTRQVLWVFSLLTSYDNPHFNDLKTGRVGLEPITPSEGGEVAWSLNLHHPYYPENSIDSLEVAARAINNIVGGATLTSSGGRSEVQPGLESSPANCLRYTGSARLRSRSGFPSMCARPVSSAAGQAALVADVYQKWMVGAGPRAAQNAALLFENYTNPGNPQVQAVLRQLAHSPG